FPKLGWGSSAPSPSERTERTQSKRGARRGPERCVDGFYRDGRGPGTRSQGNRASAPSGGFAAFASGVDGRPKWVRIARDPKSGACPPRARGERKGPRLVLLPNRNRLLPVREYGYTSRSGAGVGGRRRRSAPAGTV